MRAAWYVRRPRTFGAHAIALTPERRIILVRLRYARGWRVPGGGRQRDEPAEQAALRELTEEIGMTAHGRVRLACELEQQVDFRRDLAALFLVDDVRYQPRRWSRVVEAVGEFGLDALPQHTAASTRRWIETVRPSL
jgi:8-oxo-dGTP pyrophosphatase MutT (NUDIX family)